MSSNISQFNTEIDAFAKTVPDKVTDLQRKIVFYALMRLIEKTPVDTGYARFNWQTTIGSPAEGQVGERQKSTAKKGERHTERPPIRPEDQVVIDKGLAVIASLPPYQVVWISNNVDYIELLEDRWSKQAPEGMLAITVQELLLMFEKVNI
jgi:hypothetical protein